MPSGKPNIICPHCEEWIEAKDLAASRQYRTEYGIDVFRCHKCHKDFKIEPTEYMLVKSKYEEGEVLEDEDLAIEGIDAKELTPSEMAAKNSTSANKGCLGSIVVGLSISLSLGWLGYQYFGHLI